MAGNLDTPYSRREIFYKGILDQDPDSLPDPETREERYLKAIAEAYPTPVEATVTQDEGSGTTSVMSQKAVTDALDGLRNGKLDKTGTAPLADNLTPYSTDSGVTQTTPFIAQGTGCGNGESIVDTGSFFQFKKKLGNTVTVNSLIDPDLYLTGTYSDVVVTKSGNKLYANGTANGTAYIRLLSNTGASVPTINGHKYLVLIPTVANVTYYDDSTVRQYNLKSAYFVFEGSGIDIKPFARVDSGATLTNAEIWMYMVDLSLWYGSTSAIPAHLLSHPENFGRYYSGSLDYNPGQLVNADGSALKSVGRNCWDGENDVTAIPNQAYYCKGTATITYKDRGGNTISTASVTNDSFTTPADCFSFGVSGTGVTISLYYSDESGYDTDYPYSVLAQIDTGSEVLRSAGSVADEKTSDGTITRNILDLDLGDFNWSRYTGYSNLFYVNTTTLKGAPSNSSISNVKCAKYVACPAQVIGGSGYTDGYVAVDSNGRIYINDPNYTNQNTFKTAMSGVHLYAEARTPTTEQGTPFSGASADNFAIDDFGSMYWTQSAGVPQGVEIFYPYDYKAAVDTLLNMVEGDVEELVTETELGAVADRIPEAPAEDGTYTLKATVADGVKTYAWVADE